MKKYGIITLLLFSIYFTSINSSYPNKFFKKIQMELDELRDKIRLKDIFDKYNMTKYFGEEERAYAEQMISKYNLDIEDLLMVLLIESRGNPKAVNTISNATGLIQWLPSTAKCYGVTVKEIYSMPVIDQLKLIDKYLEQVKETRLNGGNYNSFTNLYLAVFHPNALGKSNSYVIGGIGSKAVAQNKGVDVNKDGIITVKDVIQFIS